MLIRVTVNGQARQFQAGAKVRAILEAEGECAGHVLVEVNRRYVPARMYDSWDVNDGDDVELILPAFGG